MDEEIKLRRLVIKAYHMHKVEWGSCNKITTDGVMTVSKETLEGLVSKYPQIHSIDVQLIRPGDLDRWTNTIMDIIPISAKVLGSIGEGITHTVTGVYMLLTGVDVQGKQAHEFGSSEGNLRDTLLLGRAGTPGENDYMISFDITFHAEMGQERAGVTAAHAACDEFIQPFRDQLKRFNGDSCSERHTYYDTIRPGKKKVVIMKQTAGQGAMYDTHLFAREPSGALGSHSIIEMGNMPVLVTPNEYRDGIIHSMQ